MNRASTIFFSNLSFAVSALSARDISRANNLTLALSSYSQENPRTKGSPHHLAAVRLEQLAGDEAGALAQQKVDHRGNFFRLA